MRCPACSSLDDKVVDSRLADDGGAIRRRRECLSCGRRFTTFERLDEVAYMRFASVYKGFEDRGDFEREAGLLAKATDPKRHH